jgi:hypothetical protein
LLHLSVAAARSGRGDSVSRRIGGHLRAKKEEAVTAKHAGVEHDATQGADQDAKPAYDRRNLLGRAGIGATAAAFLGALGPVGAFLASGGTARAQSAAFTDQDIFNFALNLEYLEGNYYLLGTTGSGVPANLTTGTGVAGGVNGGTKVPWANFLRSQLGSAAVAQPLIDLAGGFQQAALASGAIAPGQVFNPFDNEVDFFLGAFALTEVGVTAYVGASALLSNPNNISNAAAILSAEGYHAGSIRTVLTQTSLGGTQPGVQNLPADITAGALLPYQTQAVANGESQLSGAVTGSGITNPANQLAKITNTDGNSLNYARTPSQVISVVYGGPTRNKGNFFPNGLNGNIR